MKFTVTRSSIWCEDDPKCPGVQKELIEKEGELIEAYTIDINTLDELLKLIKDVGHSIIVFEHGYVSPLPELEIYDGYRE
jgi:hypothetical protein